MIIDFHSHNFPSSLAARAMTSMCHKTEGVLWPAGDGTLNNHLDNLELAGVDKAVSLPIATKPNMFEGILGRALAIQSGELGERAQRMIVPFASVHPLDEHYSAHLKAIAESGIKGIKFHSYYQDFSLADKQYYPLFRKAAELGLIVVGHCGYDVGWRNIGGKCGPNEIAALLRAVPDLKFVAAHLGGIEGYPPHTIDVLLDSNCYIDTSILAYHWHYDESLRVLRSFPTERVLFGTDFPWVNLSEAIRMVKSVRVVEDQAAIFSGNAMRLLGL